MIAAGGSASPALTQRQVLLPGEVRATQYGPEWTAHVMAGGAVREGNILIPL